MTISNDKNIIMTVLNFCNDKETDSEFKLLRKSYELAKKAKVKNIAVIIGNEINNNDIEDISKYSDKVVIYEDNKLSLFNGSIYSTIVKEFINKNKPRFLLMNNDDMGRIISSRIGGYFDSSVLTNCEDLEINKDGNFVDVKTIGNKEIEIISKANIQIATLNIKKIKLCKSEGDKKAEIIKVNIDEKLLNSAEEILNYYKVEEKMSIDKAEILVVAGKGVREEADLELVEKLAKALGGEIAFTRPLVQLGWAEHVNQVGISGTRVKPKLIITVGVSGASQFTDAMKESKHIISINCNPKAPIFNIAHCGIVGDLYEIIPRLLDKIN